jgi:hypothetical protein
VAYQPSTLEEHTVWARFDGTPDYAAVDTPTMGTRVDEIFPTFEAEGRPLEAVRVVLPWAVGLIVLTTWIVVIGALVRAAVGIRSIEEKAQPA